MILRGKTMDIFSGKTTDKNRSWQKMYNPARQSDGWWLSAVQPLGYTIYNIHSTDLSIQFNSKGKRF